MIGNRSMRSHAQPNTRTRRGRHLHSGMTPYLHPYKNKYLKEDTLYMCMRVCVHVCVYGGRERFQEHQTTNTQCTVVLDTAHGM